MPPKVLIADGSETDRAATARLLAAAGYEVGDAPDGIEAFEKLLEWSYDLVVTEARLDRLDGPDLIVKLRAHGVKTPVLVLSACTKAATLTALMKLGIVDYVHKASPPETILQKIAAALPAPPAAAPGDIAAPAPPAAAVVSPRASVLALDTVESEHQHLRALFPPSIHLDACNTFNEVLSRARGGHYRMLLLDSEATVLNLGGIVAQAHVLQPEAALVAVATLGRHDERAAMTESLQAFGFDAVVFRPLAPEEVTLLVERHCTAWADLVGVKDDLIEVSRLRCRREHHVHYLHELTTGVEAALRKLSDACFDRAILDLTRVEQLDALEIAELLERLDGAAAAFGVTLVAAVAPAVSAGLHAFQESFSRDHFRWFASAADARAHLR